MNRFALISSLCLTALSFCACGSDDKNDTPANEQNGCVEATYTPTCSDDLSAVIRCKNGKLSAELCTGSAQCIPETAACSTTGSQIPDNDDPGSQPSTPGSECNPSTYPTYCNGSSKRVTCNNGHIETITCPSGTECDSATKQCLKPSGSNQNNNIGAKCDPDTFSESCYSSDGTDSAIFCDPNTYTVKRIPCTDYGDNYKFCDIAENYYGDGRNIVICSLPKDECTPGDTYAVCEDDSYYDDELEEGKQFSETTYECMQFSIYTHYYVAQERACAKHCKDASSCYEYKD